jgi:hypothetical protein
MPLNGVHCSTGSAVFIFAARGYLFAMSKELPYFRFTASEWLNDDISLEDYSVKGVFADICAYYWFKDCSITQAMLEKRFSNAKDMLKQLFNNGIIKLRTENDFIEITFLDEQYDQLSESRKRRQNAGAKGGKKRSSIAKALLKQSSSYKDNNKDKDKDKERYIIPPTFEMVKKYCDERNNGIDPQYFIDNNSLRGWVYGKNKTKIVDWKACVRTWEQYQKKDSPKLKMP